LPPADPVPHPQIPTTHLGQRIRLQRNIGIAFARMGAWQDAITAFEAAMDAAPDFTAGFNLLLCY
jgi:hypothetical protein